MFDRNIVFRNPAEINFNRDERQRSSISVEDLLPSIRQRGVMNPIIVDREGDMLIAGERRLTACRELNIEVPVRYAQDLTAEERTVLEWEENVQREDLSWEDRCKGAYLIHHAYKKTDPNWTGEKTAELLGLSRMHSLRLLTVGEEIVEGTTNFEGVPTLQSAYNKVANIRERKLEAAMDELSSDIADALVEPGETRPAKPVAAQAPKEIPAPIINTDFIQWADSYTDRTRFNLLHIDFPYGLDLDDSDQAKTYRFGKYDDSPDLYWELCGALCRNLDNIVSSSAHIIFWFSMEFYIETLEFFQKNAPDLVVQRKPLYWHKTDNKGIAADTQRRPRDVMETAFFMSRGDRKIVELVSNTYGCPTSKVIHQSEKPIPMLKHFFRMVVDEHTRMLDPTSGSGNSLIAALDRGAGKVLGIERDENYFTASVEAFRKHARLKALEGELNDPSA